MMTMEFILTTNINNLCPYLPAKSLKNVLQLYIPFTIICNL